MNNRTDRLKQIPPDWESWPNLYYQYQQSYIRQKLLAIKYLWLGYSRQQVTQMVSCSYLTLTQWLDDFLSGGLSKLTQPITHLVPSRLNQEQQIELKRMLLEDSPKDYGIDKYIWTAKIIITVLKEKWDVSLKDTRIYEILDELNLSHQKAHRDYANADSYRQKQFVDILKKKISCQQIGEKIIFFDEFAVYDRPSLFYTWAEKNSRPEIASNERRRNKVNGFFCVDALTGEEYLKLSDRAKTENIVSYFAELCSDVSQQGFQKLTVFLDNNSTHKQKMQRLLQLELVKMKIQSFQVEFIYTPPYSTNYNLVEYLIHQLRLQLLHHQPVNTTIEEVRYRIEQYLQANQLQTPQQIKNIINHILALAK